MSAALSARPDSGTATATFATSSFLAGVSVGLLKQ